MKQLREGPSILGMDRLGKGGDGTFQGLRLELVDLREALVDAQGIGAEVPVEHTQIGGGEGQA